MAASRDGLLSKMWHKVLRLGQVLADLLRAPSAVVAARRTARQPRTPQQVVFVSDRPGSREAKLAYGLQQAGWFVILLHRDQPTFDASRYCVQARSYRGPWEALALCACYTPVVYHVFSSWNFRVAVTLIRHRPGKIVFDDYDVMAGMVQEQFLGRRAAGILRAERFCLESAEGLCCRSLETQYAKRHLGYRYRGRRMLLLDGCWANLALPEPASKSVEEGFHIVYCGNLGSRDEESANGLRYDLFELARLLAAQGVHLHIYPAFEAWAIRSSYMELANTTPFFHFHPPVQSDELVRQMAQYDAGLRVFMHEYRKAYTEWKLAYAPSNKIFDYLDAGLPVIINGFPFQAWLLKRVGVALLINDELKSYAKRYRLQIDWGALRPSIAQARARFAVRAQVNRLVLFYESL
jgi:hypothetical protein